MKLKITVHGVAYDVDVEVLDAKDEMRAVQPAPLPAALPTSNDSPPAGQSSAPTAPAAARPAVPQGGGAGSVTSPIAGTVLEVKCKPGDNVVKGQALLIIEAMKMETTIAAPVAGTVKSVAVAAGDAVRESQSLVEFG